MALTDEQKEFLRWMKRELIIMDKEKNIEKIFPEAFEPELVDFRNAKYGFGELIQPSIFSADELGIKRGHGLYFSSDKLKNPKLHRLVSDSIDGWVLTFEKK